MEDTSSNISSKYHTNRESDMRGTDLDCASNLLNGWQSELELGDCMLRLFDAGLWTDISFHCSDQSEENLNDRIRAHKIVLAARSPVFQAMFFGPCQDRRAVIEIQDAESQDFKLFLRLLYSDQHDIVDKLDDLVGVLEIANKYQVTNIVDTCCGKLAKLINKENACAILERALLFDNKYLIKQASDFIDANANDVLQSEGFLNTTEKCLAYILKGDTFYTEEREIFKRAIEWAKQKCESTDGHLLRSTLGEAFFYLRTPCMSLNDFVACTLRKGYYSVEEYEDIMAVIEFSEQVKTNCNSSQKRFPLDLKIIREGFPKDKFNDENAFLKGASISETITINSFIDLYLTSVNLMKRSFVYPRSLFAKHYLTVDTLSILFDLQLSVSLELEDMPPLKHKVLVGPTDTHIELSKPFLVSAGKSITLRIEIELICDDNISDFQVRAAKCFKSNEFLHTVPDTVTLRTEINSARLVHFLRLQRVNSRN